MASSGALRGTSVGRSRALALRGCLKTPRARPAAADLRVAASSGLGIALLFRRPCVLATLDPALASRARGVLRQPLSRVAQRLRQQVAELALLSGGEAFKAGGRLAHLSEHLLP